MIDIKTPQEIKIMHRGGKILSETLWEVVASIKPGITEAEIEEMADTLIKEKGAEPAFKRVNGYEYATCISTNNVVVHGIPSAYTLKEGDVIGIDCGVFYKGLNTDMSETIIVKNSTLIPSFANSPNGKKVSADKQKSPASQSEAGRAKIKSSRDDEVDKFLEAGKKALQAGIDAALPGNRIGHISSAIQKVIEEDNGYSVVRALIGHGIGRSLHEAPEVPGYLTKKIEKTPRLMPGMTIAIETIYNMNDPEVIMDKDGWTISSKDGSLSGLYERSIAITDKEPLILTP